MSGHERLCLWPGCKTAVDPKRWGCLKHWYMLPRSIRDLIWATWQPGKDPIAGQSPAYLDAMATARRWVVRSREQTEGEPIRLYECPEEAEKC